MRHAMAASLLGNDGPRCRGLPSTQPLKRVSLPTNAIRCQAPHAGPAREKHAAHPGFRCASPLLLRRRQCPTFCPDTESTAETRMQRPRRHRRSTHFHGLVRPRIVVKTAQPSTLFAS
ncbi:hypothetical protein PHSY_005938 [Pseudozyma hubeiensis SY62]|uniref:Uncharacterized protein n=1 Tax=Pseudozyma hubeiensis (strain SY62) TaxID=1305764 RepID=R9PJT8_PSEHS|nr:hypothetical protein PHSY_005938 [Pseudozyma hubeiensis SY62]GAC98345.1 hypothetical protein PHSY_005938 [Pseudozyma hubeiensis SY62]